MPPEDSLARWIRALRKCLVHGGLATVAPVDIGQGTHSLSAERIVRIMLADLDGYDDMTPAETNDPVNVARRVGLLGDFRMLRILIGGSVALGVDGPRAMRDARTTGAAPAPARRYG